ncbi:MAG: peptidoglycan D,D-transpeptidase FtsI family protein [Streptosporangiaceae bacterium]
MRLSSPIRRLRVALLLFGCVLTIFCGRLVQLQTVDAAAYATQAKQQRLRTIALPAPRGDVTGAHGHTLATTVDARDIYADPTLVDDGQATAEKLGPLLDIPAKQIEEQLRTPGRYVVLKRQVSPKLARRVLSLDLPGIGAQPDSKRVYPNGKLAANLLGFVGRDGHGLAGLEHGLDGVLSGRDGKETVQIGAHGQRIPMSEHELRKPEPGRDVRLTIDRDIQWKAQRAIARQVRATRAESGTAIVMDPKTGKVLAMAAAPTYNPNHPEDYPDSVRGNPPLQDVYEPGSTNKVITMAAALEDTRLTPRSPITVPPILYRGGEAFHDAESHGVWHLTLAGVLAKSSNIGTILVSEKVGVHGLYRYLRSFGFGRETAIRFPGESGGLLPPLKDWHATRRYTVPFGQGVSVTATQMASVYATIANDGVRVDPTLVAGTSDEAEAGGGEDFVPHPPPGDHRVVSAKTANQLTAMLEEVTTDEGTAPAAEIPGYLVAGKTGTADRVDPDCGCYRGYTASFVGFAPAKDPRLLVEVVLQDPIRGHYGGQVAAPVFQDVMSFALQSLGVPPTGGKPPKLPLFAK